MLKLRLDNGCQYDLQAMFQPVHCTPGEAWQAWRGNLRGWRQGMSIPWRARPITFRGTWNWLWVMLANSLSLLLLPFLAPFGISMKAYRIFTKADQAKLRQYREDLQAVYARLNHIEDPKEYRERLQEEIERVKPYGKD